ncbi:MAG: EAL domain-containing protein [Solirubrobacteraceae bacterium]|nr:EAL domain-containing protein [Solirubrobacteraceae bacterium]
MAPSDRTRSAAHVPVRRVGSAAHEHVVEFYETEQFLCDTVTDFVGPALHDGGAVIVVATAAHRYDFEAALRRSGFDVEHAIDADRYVTFDAAGLLARFMVDGVPDARRFEDVVGDVLERAGAGDRRVRVYGEMVALLWADGETEAAIALEGLWNDLADRHEFALLCAYPMAAFKDAASAAAFQRVCGTHTTVIPSEGYSLLDGADDKRREVARLQQENAALRAEARLARAERADAAARRHLDELCVITLETITEGVVELDGEGRLVCMNPAAERLLGWAENELLGHPVEDLLHRRRPEGVAPPGADSPLAGVFGQRRTVRSREDALVRRDGRLLPVLCSATPEANGGVVIAFSDVTEEIEKRRRAERRLDTIGWISRVREAIDEDRLELHSQPILPLRGGAAREELLLRMIGRDGELIRAGAFMPAAEELGLAFEVDRWVIARAVRFAALGRIVQVNLSAASIADPRVLELVEQELRTVDAPAGNLVFEVTEAALLSDLAAGEAFAGALRGIGCGLSLDDFGNGTGGFSYLQGLSVQTLKIDIDFVRGLPGNPHNQHLVQAIVALAQSFGIETVAGGVEDDDTLALLREYGVDYAQGYAIHGLAPVARLVTPLPAQDDRPPPLVSDRARLLRGRLLDHRERQRQPTSVPGLVEVVRLSA